MVRCVSAPFTRGASLTTTWWARSLAGMVSELVTAALNTNLHIYNVAPVLTLYAALVSTRSSPYATPDTHAHPVLTLSHSPPPLGWSCTRLM